MEKLRIEIFKIVYLSHLITKKTKSEFLILLKLDKLKMAIGKKRAPATTNPVRIFYICTSFPPMQDVSVPGETIDISIDTYCPIQGFAKTIGMTNHKS